MCIEELKPISEDARHMLARIKEEPGYIRHYYDEYGKHILVYMHWWFGNGRNALGLNSFEIQGRVGGVVIPYDFDRRQAVQS